MTKVKRMDATSGTPATPAPSEPSSGSTITTLRPRRPFPAPPTRRTPLGRDIVFNRGAYDEAHDKLQRPDRYDRPAAWDAFGNGAA